MARVPARVTSQLPNELTERIATFLDSNEVACNLRLVNKAAASLFRDPRHTTVRLSQPSPPDAFAWRWSAPSATRGLPYAQRLRLLCLTATTGSLPNLQTALGSAGCLLVEKVIEAAAAAGQLEMCRSLRQRGCPLDGALAAAAEAGQQAVCEWILDSGASGYTHIAADIRWTAATAARGRHPELTDWLMRTYPQHFADVRHSGPEQLLAVAAEGCDLPTLQRLHREWIPQTPSQPEQPLDPFQASFVLTASAGSSSPDWRAKVEWLEGVGCRKTMGACWGAAACSGDEAVERIAWLQQRGYPINNGVVASAARVGNLAAVKHLQAQGVSVTGAAGRAAARGHLEVVAWLVETAGEQVPLCGELLEQAARSGSLALLRWLRERGCPWGERVFACAAEGGNEEALEWLVEQGCPMRNDGDAYAEACGHNDTSTLHCLLRLGCPWGPVGKVFTDAVCSPSVSAEMLRILLHVGCPVESGFWGKAETMVRRQQRLDEAVVLGLLEEERERRRHEPGAA